MLGYNSEVESEDIRVVVCNSCKSSWSHRIDYFLWEIERGHVLVYGFEIKLHRRSNLKHGCVIEVVEITWC